MYIDDVENLYAAIWFQALKDFKKEQKNEYLRDWIINDGRCKFVPHFSKREVEKILNEYLSK